MTKKTKRQISMMIVLLAVLAYPLGLVAPAAHAAVPQKVKAKQQPSQPAMPGVPATVQRPTPEQAQAQQTAPFPDEQKAPLALLGLPVRACIGGHMATVFLTDYDLSDKTYDGLLVRDHSMNAGDVVPHFEAVHGLRPYPYAERPDYAFQFILPGEDESVLINIALKNASR